MLAGAQVDPATLQIVKPGQAPNDLLDRRDLLLDKLGKLANVSSVTYDDQNRATVVVAGLTVVTPTAGATAITRAQMDAQFTSGALTGGALHALEDAYGESPQRGQRDLVSLAAERARPVAARRGQRPARARRRPSGTAGGLFFDFTSATGAARCGRADHDVGGDPRRIRPRSPPAPPARVRARPPTPTRMVALQNAITTGGTTFLDYYNGLQSGLGTATQSTARSLDAQQIVVGGLSDRRGPPPACRSTRR